MQKEETAYTPQTGHIGLNITNLNRSLEFYQRVFGYQVLAKSGEGERGYAFLGSRGIPSLTLWEQSTDVFDKNRPGLHHLSFQADTIDHVREIERRLNDMKVHFHYEGVVPHAEGVDSGGVFFEDPDGIRLEVYSPAGAGERPVPVPGAPSCGFF